MVIVLDTNIFVAAVLGSGGASRAVLRACLEGRLQYGWRPNLRNEADNHLIELAVAGGAAIIVTKNVKDFRGAELHFPGLRVLSPEKLLQEI